MSAQAKRQPAGRERPGRSQLPAAAKSLVLTLRVDFGDERALGPGKVRLMELIADLGSISAAGRAMGMSYRRAWLLVDALNAAFREPLVDKQTGGSGGGGAGLTAFGREVVRRYRFIEKRATAAAAKDLEVLSAALAPRR